VRQYNCKYFTIEELVPKEYMDIYTESQLWAMFDDRLLKGIDLLRDDFGKVTINDWSWGGKFNYSGLRPQSWYMNPSASQHCYGRGADLKFKEVDAETVRTAILANEDRYSRFISRLEKDVAWLHCDIANTTEEGIYQFSGG